MAKYQITSPDGQKYQITAPDGATDQQIMEYAQTAMQNPVPGTQSVFVDQREKSFPLGFVKGVLAPLDVAGMGLEEGLKAIGVPTDKVNDFLGMKSTKELRASRPEYFAKQEKAPAGSGEFAGNVIGTLPALMAPGGPAVQGALTGTLLTQGDKPMDYLMGAGLGALGGKAGDLAVKGLSRVISPKVAPAVRSMIDEHVPLTPGQIIGGSAKRTEQALTSVPFLGDAIKRAQTRGIQGFNRAAFNRALKPLGKSLPDNINIGRDAVEYTFNQMDDAYNKLLPMLKVNADDAFMRSINSLDDLAKNLPKERYNQFSNVLKSQILDKISPAGKMTGKAMKEAESEIGRLIRNYGKSPVGDERLLADALMELRGQLRGTVMRSNPAQAQRLAAINTGYANALRLQRAATSLGAEEGVFTPAQLQNAVKAMDSSGRKKAFAEGRALLQDLSEAGKSTLSQTIPDSGTPLRTITGLGLLGGAGAVNPYAAAGAAATAIPYTEAGQRFFQSVLAQRPELAPTIAAYLSRLEGPATAGGAALLATQGAP